MAEAEDVITDGARHATAYAQTLWRRHRPQRPGPATVQLADVAPRIELLIRSVFGTSYRLRVAQPPAPTTLLAWAWQRSDRPRSINAVPATDGSSLWLPADSGHVDVALGLAHLRLLALQQAMRAGRGSALFASGLGTPLQRDIFLLLEAQAADEQLLSRLPGLIGPLNALRQAALNERPDIRRFAHGRRVLELHARSLLQRPLEPRRSGALAVPSPQASQGIATRMADEWLTGIINDRSFGSQPLFKDAWTGRLLAPEQGAAPAMGQSQAPPDDTASDDTAASKVRSARLSRRPDVRAANDTEDEARQGAWMIQPAQPHEHAEDPYGLQRPTDRDQDGAADEYAQSLSDLQQARLVSTPGQAKEVLLSDDPPDARLRRGASAGAATPGLRYPEWDYRQAAYRDPGATVHVRQAPPGPQAWVDQTLNTHRAMLVSLRRRFEMLRTRRSTLRRQTDGDDIDLEACVEAQCDWVAGRPLSPALYQLQRRRQRETAILLLIDVSGSTDGWISAHRRVIDVEREALLLVCLALDGMGEPYAVQAFSGHGPHAVTVDEIKRFDEPGGAAVARRIAGLEPDQYTRTGAALRHASAALMQRPAAQRLLLLLSDGKPNDVDVYDGRYGILDTRQAVIEAKLQGISPFCLTVDRHGGSYLPALFGAQNYALLYRPERLPLVLLGWMKHLLRA